MRVKHRRRRKWCAVSVGISTLPASSTSTTTRPEAARIPSVTNACASAASATMGPSCEAEKPWRKIAKPCRANDASLRGHDQKYSSKKYR